MSYLTVREIALDLGISHLTVAKYCREGLLPAIKKSQGKRPYFAIPEDKYYLWKQESFKGRNKGQGFVKNPDIEISLEKFRELSDECLSWCLTGQLSGKPIAERTATLYKHYINLYIAKLGKYPPKPLISIDNLRKVLGSFPIESHSTKVNIYAAIMCVTKFLIEKGLFTKEERESFRKLRPKRFLPAKKTIISEEQIKMLLKEIASIPNNSTESKLLNEVLVKTLASTGLRASELCNLKLQEVDFCNRRIYVKLGKGNKNRVVGITDECLEVLTRYLRYRVSLKTELENFFLNRYQRPFNKETLCKKINRLGRRINLDISNHTFRRAFVTINVNKGRPLVHLQIACGHSDIATTRGYCMTSQDEVVEAMQGW
jgi:integrase/recombinase XerD